MPIENIKGKEAIEPNSIPISCAIFTRLTNAAVNGRRNGLKMSNLPRFSPSLS